MRPPAPNSKLVRELPHVARELVDKKIRLKCMLGPYSQPPIPNLLCSPLNLVPKPPPPDGAAPRDSHRLIHDLAYPYSSDSINATIPEEEASVKYERFDQVMALGLRHGNTAFTSKTDFWAVFRLFPVRLQDLHLLGFPLGQEFFINSSMAFGCRSSCKLFEDFSVVMQHIHEQETRQKNTSHYLDDFIMVQASAKKCGKLLRTLQRITHEIGAPLSPEKTHEPTQLIQYLGMLLDFFWQVIQIPKALNLIEQALGNPSGKMKVREVQRITGVLQFITRACLLAAHS